MSVLHHHPHLYEHRADDGEFALSFLTSGAAEAGEFGRDLGGGKVHSWDPTALGEHGNDQLVETQGGLCNAAGTPSIWPWPRVAWVSVFLCLRVVVHPMNLSQPSKG